MRGLRPRTVTTQPDDGELVAATRKGDLAAFGELVHRHQDRLHSSLYRLTGSREDASDLAQEAFCKAYENLGKFHGDSAFYTWLYRISMNLAKSARRCRRVPIRWSLGRAQGIDPPDDPSRTEPSRAVEASERDAQVHAALMGLAEDHRAVVVMKDLEGMRYDEIAKVLGVPVGTVRSRLHRARLDLRDRLRGLVDIEDPCSEIALAPLSHRR